MPINYRTNNTVKYKSKAVENLEDSYIIKLIKKEYSNNEFPITGDLIKAKRFNVLANRMFKGKLTKEQTIKFLKELDLFFKNIVKDINKD